MSREGFVMIWRCGETSPLLSSGSDAVSRWGDSAVSPSPGRERGRGEGMWPLRRLSIGTHPAFILKGWLIKEQSATRPSPTRREGNSACILK
jgi:hypothetical protein